MYWIWAELRVVPSGLNIQRYICRTFCTIWEQSFRDMCIPSSRIFILIHRMYSMKISLPISCVWRRCFWILSVMLWSLHRLVVWLIFVSRRNHAEEKDIQRWSSVWRIMESECHRSFGSRCLIHFQENIQLRRMESEEPVLGWDLRSSRKRWLWWAVRSRLKVKWEKEQNLQSGLNAKQQEWQWNGELFRNLREHGLLWWTMMRKPAWA